MKLMIAILFIAHAVAAPPASSLIKLRLSYGEKITRIEVKEEKKKFFGVIITPEGSRQKELKKADVDYLMAKLKGEKSRKEGDCPRQEIEAEFSEKKTFSKFSACLGSGTELSKKLQGMADLLSTAI